MFSAISIMIWISKSVYFSRDIGYGVFLLSFSQADFDKVAFLYNVGLLLSFQLFFGLKSQKDRRQKP